jgi:hypothetical protein
LWDNDGVKLHVDQDYPATIDRLWTVFSDPKYPGAKHAALGATHVEMAAFSASPREIAVDLCRRVPVDATKIPGFARKLLGEEQTMRQQTRWLRISPEEVRATLTITPVGRPLRIAGTARLTPLAGASSRLSFEFEVSSDVPLIGAKIAALFAGQMEAALKADHAFTLDYLQRAG